MSSKLSQLLVLAFSVSLFACGGDPSVSTSEEGAALSGSTPTSTSTWPYPVPTGCVSISATQCRTNVGHYDVTEAQASLDASMAAAGYVKGYSTLCRSNTGYTKGSTKVCYRVGVVTNSSSQVIGSQWNGFRE